MPRRSRVAIEDEDSQMEPPARRRRLGGDVDVSDAAVSDNQDGSDAEDASYSSHDQMVKKMVRLALAHEVSRRPIRRTDVSEKVLGTASRAFKRVFEDANKQLQAVFGMTMSELPQKQVITTQQKRAAQRSQGTSSNPNKSYIVTSTLAASYRRAAILPPTKSPSVELEAQYVGLYTWIITIILLSNGQRISEGKLDSYLLKMNAGENVAGDRTEKMLKRMEKEGYITKIKEREAGAEETVDWIVGPRGKLEVGEHGVAGMVRAVYGARDGAMRDLEDRLDKSLGEGTFKRRTEKGESNQEDGADDEEQGNENGGVPAPTPSAPRGSSRRSRAAEEEADEDEEDGADEAEGFEDDDE